MRRFFVAIVLGFTVSAAPAAQPSTGSASAPLTTMKVEMSPDEIVAARRAAFYLSAMTMARMKDALANETSDIKEMKWPAQFMAQWAASLPTMFPPGSSTPQSEALAVVWTDRPGFIARAKDYQAAALELAKIAATGDRKAFAAGRERLVQTCNSCHKSFRND